MSAKTESPAALSISNDEGTRSTLSSDTPNLCWNSRAISDVEYYTCVTTKKVPRPQKSAHKDSEHFVGERIVLLHAFLRTCMLQSQRHTTYYVGNRVPSALEKKSTWSLELYDPHALGKYTSTIEIHFCAPSLTRPLFTKNNFDGTFLSEPRNSSPKRMRYHATDRTNKQQQQHKPLVEVACCRHPYPSPFPPNPVTAQHLLKNQT